MSINKVTALCSNKTCCPTAEVNTETELVTITDDYNHTLVLPISEFLGFDAVINREEYMDGTEYDVVFSGEGTVTLTYEGQKVEGITIEQWAILNEAVRDADDCVEKLEQLLSERGDSSTIGINIAANTVMFNFNVEADTVTIADGLGGNVTMSFNQWAKLRDEESYSAVNEALGPKENYRDLYDGSKKPVEWVNPASVKTVASSMLSFEVLDGGKSVILADKFGNSTTFSRSQLLQVDDFIGDLGKKFGITGKGRFIFDSEDPITVQTWSREKDHLFSQYFIISRQGDYGDTAIGQAPLGYKGEDSIGFSIEDWQEFINETGLK